MTISLSDLKNSRGSGLVIPGQAIGDRLGSEVYGAGDINGDGIDDLVVTATDAGIASIDPYSYYDSDRRGKAYVVFGSKDAPNNLLNLDSLDGSNGFTVSGLDAEHNLGDAVAAGDINGDGIDDLVLGAPQAGARVSSYGYSYSENNGEAYVIFGRRNGFTADFELQNLDGSNGFTIKGIDASDLLGTAISAGDINGDGVDDLAVSAVGGGRIVSNSNGFPDSNRHGEVYVLFGDRNGFESRINLFNLNGSNGFIIDGKDSNDSLGSALSSAGDINGDGINDLIIGAPNAGEVRDSPFANGDSDQRGEVYVLFGRRSGFNSRFSIGDRLDGNNGFIISGIGIEDNLGSDVSSVGDINGDGIEDLIIGAPNASIDGEYTQEGQVYVLFGDRNGFASRFDLNNLDGSNGFSIDTRDSDTSGLGNTVSAGDFNGDRIDDLLIGASEGGEIRSAYGFEYSDRRGAAYVVFGKSDGFTSQLNLANLSNSEGIKITGISEGDLLGSNIASGDLNDDGTDDLIVSATGVDLGEYTREGTTYVIFDTSQDSQPAPSSPPQPIASTQATPYHDKLYGSLFGDRLFGLGGNDTIDGGDGDDDISGDGGGDSLFGGNGSDILAGGNNNDTLFGGRGADFLNGGNNQDKLIGDAGQDTLVGGADNDRLEGGEGNDILNGIDPSNSQVQLGEQDTLVGGEGADLFILGDENKVYYDDRNSATEGSTDYAFIEDFNPAEDKIQLKGDRSLYSLSSYSDAGGNVLTNIFYQLPDTKRERIGILKNVPTNLTLDNSAFIYLPGEDEPEPTANRPNTNTINGRATPYNDEIIGSYRDDSIAGQSGDDTISGGDGDDTLDGQDSSDLLFGDRGKDILYGGNNNDTLSGGVDNDLLEGGNNQDRLAGDDGNDTLIGGKDNDLLDGGKDNDILRGSDPDIEAQLGEQDTLIGGQGADLFILGDENKLYYDDLNSATEGSIDYALIEDFNPAEDKIQLKGDRNSYNLSFYSDSSGNSFANIFYLESGHSPERIGIVKNPSSISLDDSSFVYLSAEEDFNSSPLGTPYNDRLVGTSDQDNISGDSGDDTLSGGDGNDLLFGNSGGDYLFGDGGDDTLSGGDNNDILFGSSGNDVLNGDRNQDRLIGGYGNDLLLGGTENDLLEGGPGDDALIGADYGNMEVQLGEQDTLIGGAGRDFLMLGDRDRMFYNDRNPDTAGDTDYALIQEFDFLEDTIQLQGSRNMYDLSFYRDGSGTTFANILYLEPGSVPERVGIIENASLDLTTDSRAFFFV